MPRDWNLNHHFRDQDVQKFDFQSIHVLVFIRGVDGFLLR